MLPHRGVREGGQESPAGEEPGRVAYQYWRNEAPLKSPDCPGVKWSPTVVQALAVSWPAWLAAPRTDLCWPYPSVTGCVAAGVVPRRVPRGQLSNAKCGGPLSFY